MNIFTDVDFIKRSLEADDFQLVYGVLYINAIYESDESDFYLNNHIVSLCKKQPTKVVQIAKAKRWIRLLNKVLENLNGLDCNSMIHIPHCMQYYWHIEETKEQYLMAISILEDFLDGNFLNMEYIDDYTLTDIPSIYEMFEKFGKLNKNKSILLSDYLRNEIGSYFSLKKSELDGTIETMVDKSIDRHIANIYDNLMNGKIEKELELSFKRTFGESVLEDCKIFNDKVISFYELNILTLDCIALLNGIDHPFTYSAVIKEEMYRRGLETKESYKTQWYEENLYCKLFTNRENIVNIKTVEVEEIETDEEPEEKRYKGYYKKRIGVLYYMLHDALRDDELLTKVVNYVLNRDYKPGSKNGNTPYKYINNIGSEVLNDFDRVDYIIEQLLRYNIPIPDEVQRNARKKK